MILHYLKIAWRNLLKYRMQTAVSVLGLAAGFVCFALSAFWIHYEMTYDSFRRDADRLYVARVNDGYKAGKMTERLPVPMAAYLTEHYPEVESAAYFRITSERVEVDGVERKVNVSSADSAWIQLLDAQLVDGSFNFMQRHSDEVAITEEAARQWFGKESPLGKEVDMKSDGKKKIGAVVRVNCRHTNYPFSLMQETSCGRNNWWYHLWTIVLKLKEGTDVVGLQDKMTASLPHELIHPTETRHTGIERLSLTPLTELRYTKDFRDSRKGGITFRYIVYFSLVGVLVIVCALINYLTMFVNRMQVRQREMALRLVHGASLRSLVRMLGMEFLMLMLSALFVGMILMELLFTTFIRLAEIDVTRTVLYGEAMAFLGLMMLVLLVVALGFIYRMQQQALSRSAGAVGHHRLRSALRRGSLVFQLFVCMLFVTGTLLMNRQLDYLRQHDLGMELENRAYFALETAADTYPFEAKLKSLPLITEVLPTAYYPLVSKGPQTIGQIFSWEGAEHQPDAPLPVNLYLAGDDFFRFYGLTPLAGECTLQSYQDIVLNESLVRRMGYTPEEAIGKHIRTTSMVADKTITGVVKDFQYVPPTEPMPATGFIFGDEVGILERFAGILFKYKEGTWDECRALIEDQCRTEAPGKAMQLYNEEESYNEFLHSERMLSRLLTFASLVCGLVAVFGIYSLITLTCEQRRKEIAVRKVNGATAKDVLSMFCREYLVILGVAALLAFPVVYAVVKRWMETYTRQVEMDVLPFLSVFLLMAVVVLASIGRSVWRAANENPAEVVKRE